MNEFMIMQVSLLTTMDFKLLKKKKRRRKEKQPNNFSSQWRCLVSCRLDGVIMETEALTLFIKRINENLKKKLIENLKFH